LIHYPDALAAHLDGDVTTLCHCWRVARKDGEVAGFTDHDRALVLDGLSYEPETGFAASEARDTLGLSIDTVDVEGALSSDRISDADISAGLYDGAKVETLLVNWRSPEQFALIRSATIGKITRRDDAFVAELESRTRALDQPNGRYVTRLCDAELGDGRCTVLLDQSAFSGAGAVTAVGPPDTVTVAGLDAFASGWFSNGILTWSAGTRAGRADRIADHRVERGAVVLRIMSPLGPAITPADTFTIVAGCDKSFATCKAKFDNGLNFRGFPHLPGNDAAYGYVTDGGNFDGGPIVS
jgi:uncharacterized phage protein (TIGR02218 family)